MVTLVEYYASGEIYKFEDDILLSMWETLANEVKRQKREMDILEMVLQRRMQENNAKRLLSTTLTVELGPPSYDSGKLRALAEHFTPEFFQKGFTPAHEETVVREVPDRFDMRTVGSWKSYGQHIVDIINAAEIPESRRISIKLKNSTDKPTLVRRTRGNGRYINYPRKVQESEITTADTDGNVETRYIFEAQEGPDAKKSS